MPKTSDTIDTIDTEPVVAAVSDGILFSFPTIGQGITVKAPTYEEALAIALKLQ